MATLQERMALAKQHFERVNEKKLKNTEMANYCKVSKVSIGQWFNGPTQNLEGANLTLAAEYLGVSHKWLSGENAPMLQKKPEDVSGFNNIQLTESKLKKIPVLDFVQAGTWREVAYDGAIPLNYTFTDYEGSDVDAIFCVIVDGLSMSPTFEKGDKLIVDASRSPKPGSFVIAQNGEHEVTFKKYRVTGYDEFGREEFELVPLNPDFPVLSSKTHNISIVGVVVRHVRDFK
ncbi:MULTISPECIES: S24 family peptidase [Acinetobacter]|uniref:S24 family peptidase n=1 Tax=Acinetobacter TaxID=469 RepID=UPI000EA1ADC7|nr:MULTISPECIES: S24 family peptidase [Acinetobacter]RKG45142.1 helix-turn-helix domain-containing protein [Acinetobacter cumulans]RZG60120.1 helix-turn-helix domain-containing protein [Acinetobacter sp. WCHAc060006]